MLGNFISWDDATEIVWLAEQRKQLKQHLEMGSTDTYLLDNGGHHQVIILNAATQQAIFYATA